jgi:hypothetical protein
MVKTTALATMVGLLVGNSIAVMPLELRDYVARDGRRIAVQREILYDFEGSAVFAAPGNLAVDAPRGEIYVVDHSDQVVRRISATGDVETQYGSGLGEGPGQFGGLHEVAVLDTGVVVLLDIERPSISIFDRAGSFLGRRRLALPPLQQANGFFFVDATHFVIGTTGLHPSLHGRYVQAFDLDSDSPDGLEPTRSFAETIEIAPGFYSEVAGGRITRDLDGQVLYTQRTPYSVRKYSQTGDELWRVDDPDALRPVMEHFSFRPNGTIDARFYPLAHSLLPLDEGRYLHTIFDPLDDWDESLDVSPYSTRIEILSITNGTLGDRVVADLGEYVFFYATDSRGGAIGYEGDGERLVRWTFEVH